MIITSTAILTLFSAWAQELDPYVSAKLTYGNISSYTNVGLQAITTPSMGIETPIDHRFSDWVFGGQLAVGISPWQIKNIRHEFSYYITAKQSNSLDVVVFSDPVRYNLGLKTQSMLLHNYYDFPTDSKFTPFAGFGIGVGHLKRNIQSILKSDGYTGNRTDKAFTFAYDFLAGTRYELNERLSLDFTARYFNLGKLDSFIEIIDTHLELPLSFYANSSNHADGFDFAIGFRYYF